MRKLKKEREEEMKGGIRVGMDRWKGGRNKKDQCATLPRRVKAVL